MQSMQLQGLIPVLQHPPGGLWSENHWTEDLAQGSRAEQVLGADLAHSSEMP